MTIGSNKYIFRQQPKRGAALQCFLCMFLFTNIFIPKILGNDIFISEIASRTFPFKNFQPKHLPSETARCQIAKISLPKT